jgi:hypothetical protein
MKVIKHIAVVLILLAATWVVYGGIEYASARKAIVANTAITP